MLIRNFYDHHAKISKSLASAPVAFPTLLEMQLFNGLIRFKVFIISDSYLSLCLTSPAAQTRFKDTAFANNVMTIACHATLGKVDHRAVSVATRQ